jgi:hypothetical protein
MTGKGDKRRPRHVAHEVFSENWDRIFGKEKLKEQVDSADIPRDKNGEINGSTHKSPYRWP